MEKIIKYLSALDWILGTATIAYGLVVGPTWIVIFGIVGLLTAWFKPAVLFQSYLKKRFLAKSESTADTAQVQQAEAFYSEMLSPGSDASVGPLVPARETHFRGGFTFGQLALGGSKHNVLKNSHFNLYRDTTAPTLF